MWVRSAHQRWTVAGILGFAVLALLLGNPDKTSLPAADAQEKNADGPTKLYFGVSACRTCHTNPPPLKAGDPPLLCRCNEAPIWEEKDKHKNAFKVLGEERGKQMGKILGINPLTHKDCVICHGVYVTDDKLVDGSFKRELDQGENSVSCVVCHGAFAEWVDMHGSALEKKRKQWRALTRLEKEKKFGMTDLWDPAKRAAMCASCHVGSAEEGKVVTHDMYAAGHPPLPSFEIATFSEAMPRHWEYLRDKKPPEIQKELGYNPAELEQTKLILVGGIVAFREAMELLAAEAAQGAGTAAGGNGWPELAQFDCYACHHDLKTESWRQKRGYVGKPGRPTMQNWPLALVRVGARLANADEKQLDSGLAELIAAFDAQPFGKPQQIAAQAKKLAQWADGVAKELNAKTIDDEAAQRCLSALATSVKTKYPDYDSARQIAWALKIASGEIKLKGKLPEEDNLEKIIAAMERDLYLTLPSGQEEKILSWLPRSLQKLNNFEPERFKRNLDKLSTLLPAK